MSWPAAFHCSEADFFVRSTREDPPVTFGVLRKALSGSDVFRAYHAAGISFAPLKLMFLVFEGDMFDCCEGGSTLDEVLDLEESADTLSILLSLLHTKIDPPEHIPNPKPYGTAIRAEQYESGSVIPFPLLPTMLRLVDKYALSETVQRSLLAHLSCHTAAYPLEVYGYATAHGLRDLAADASMHLLHPPLSSYSPNDLKVIPVPEAWHELVLLHEVRIRGLRRLLLAEEIFPCGYGQCSSHKDKTLSLWKQRKNEIILRVEAGKVSYIVSTHALLINMLFQQRMWLLKWAPCNRSSRRAKLATRPVLLQWRCFP